jgi:hypothetical protein
MSGLGQALNALIITMVVLLIIAAISTGAWVFVFIKWLLGVFL